MQYRLVHYVPNPLHQARFPVGALVSDGVSTRLVVRRHLPDAVGLGGHERRSICDGVLKIIGRAPAFDGLPRAVQTSAALGDPLPIPAHAEAEAWVRAHVFEERAHEAEVGERRRSTLGFAALWDTVRPFKIRKRWLQHRFLPRTHASLRDVPALAPVTHWVDGPGGLLLLEPIVLLRRQLIGEVDEVCQTFATYRVGLAGREGAFRLAAYVVGAGRDRDAVCRDLGVYAHRVYALDTAGRELATDIRACVLGPVH